MKKYMVNMVHPQQIVQKGLKGCKTSRTVTGFAQWYGVPCVWWKPTTNQKVMLVDWNQFRQAWNKAGSTYQNKTWGQRASFHGTDSSAKTFGMKRQTKNATWNHDNTGTKGTNWNKCTTNRTGTGYKKSGKTTFRTNYTRRSKAA